MTKTKQLVLLISHCHSRKSHLTPNDSNTMNSTNFCLKSPGLIYSFSATTWF